MNNVPNDLRYYLQIEDGRLCGYIDRNCEGTYYKFKKIPYAKPPIGDLRFKAPLPIERWKNVLDCTEDPKIHRYVYSGAGSLCKIEGSEDCLYIEVSTPNVKPDKLLPVMFWIGSSHYVLYSDTMYDPSLINAQNIVFVRCSFRLGPFGFLSIKEFSAPGNSGLKDIVLALKWVQRNIKHFGGDPNNVTIFGSGTGGSIAHFMMLSPMATGLFHKIIVQSASSLNRFAIDMNPIHNVMKLAKELGITASDKMEIVEELKNVNAADLMNATTAIWEREFYVDECEVFDSIFKPCIEEELEGQPVFLNKSPEAILRSGKLNAVPMIIGSNNTEAAVLQYMKSDFYADYEKFNTDFSLIVPKTISSIDGEAAKKLGKQLIDFYFKGKVNVNDKTQYLQLLSDFHCLYYVNRTIRQHIQTYPQVPIFYYILNVAGDWSVPKEYGYYNSTGHYAEIPFLFRIKIKDSCCEGSRDAIITRKRVVKMWTNFAKYGHPTPEENDPDLRIIWDPVANEDNLNYLNIGHELTKGHNPFHDRMLFCDMLYDEYKFYRTLLYFNDIGVKW